MAASAGEPVYVPDNDDDLEDVVAAVENETASQTDSQQVQMQVCASHSMRSRQRHAHHPPRRPCARRFRCACC